MWRGGENLEDDWTKPLSIVFRGFYFYFLWPSVVDCARVATGQEQKAPPSLLNVQIQSSCSAAAAAAASRCWWPLVPLCLGSSRQHLLGGFITVARRSIGCGMKGILRRAEKLSLSEAGKMDERGLRCESGSERLPRKISRRQPGGGATSPLIARHRVATA